MQKYIFSVFLILYSTQIFSQVLPSNSPERKQLIAMGYELLKEDVKDEMTIADNGDHKISIARSKDRLQLSSSYTRKKLDDSDELKLFKIINKFNMDFDYQLSLAEETLIVTIFDFGSYDSKTFAKMIRMMEKIEYIFFDKNTELLNLLNK